MGQLCVILLPLLGLSKLTGMFWIPKWVRHLRRSHTEQLILGACVCLAVFILWALLWTQDHKCVRAREHCGIDTGDSVSGCVYSPQEADNAPSFWRLRWAPGNSCGLDRRGSATSPKVLPQNQEWSLASVLPLIPVWAHPHLESWLPVQ